MFSTTNSERNLTLYIMELSGRAHLAPVRI